MLRELHESRVAVDPAFQAVLAQEAAIEVARERKEVSLLFAARKAEYDKNKREQKERENQIRVTHGLEPLALDSDDEDDEDEKKDEEDFDVVLDEASFVVADMIRAAAPVSRLVDTDIKQPRLTTSINNPAKVLVD